MKKLTRDETVHGECYYLASEVDAQPPLPVQEPDDLEKIIDKYVEHYEMYGDEGTYTPSDDERRLIKDAIIGLLADPDWDAAWGAVLSTAQPVHGVTIEAGLRFRLDSEKQKSADLLDATTAHTGPS